MCGFLVMYVCMEVMMYEYKDGGMDGWIYGWRYGLMDVSMY